MSKRPMPVSAALVLGLALVGLGFLIGYGYQAGNGPEPLSSVIRSSQAPLVKGMHASPDGSLVAFTGVFGYAQHAAVFVVDSVTGAWNARDTPGGWQDYVTQWSPDGKSLLLEREKIPPLAETADAGLYNAIVEAPGRNVPDSGGGTDGQSVNTPHIDDLTPLTDGFIPSDQTIITGFYGQGGQLVVKTRRSPKSLLLVQGRTVKTLDNATVNYGQNRAVTENGRIVLYVVRDLPGNPDAVALFRVDRGLASQLSEPLENVTWSYLSEDCRRLIVARQPANGGDWTWTLYGVTASGAHKVNSATVPADVVSVYWSPDGTRVLGAAGLGLWIIDIPSLKVSRLGTRNDWNADDAAWLGLGNDIAVASDGEIWKIQVPDGTARRIWKFDPQYWD